MLTNNRYNHLIEGLNEWNNEYELGLNVCYQKSQIGMCYCELDIGIGDQ